MKLSQKWPHLGLYLTMGLNLLTLAGKLALSMTIPSFFLYVSSWVTLAAFLTKLIYRLNEKVTDLKKRYRAFAFMGGAIFIGATRYILCMARLFFIPDLGYIYNIYSGLAVATVAFLDLGVAFYSLIKEAKRKELLAFGLQCGAVSNGFVALMLAQTAIFSFTNPTGHYDFYNGVGGVVFGSLDAAIGLAMIIYAIYKKGTIPAQG